MHPAPDAARHRSADLIWRRALWWTYAIAGSLYVLSRLEPPPGESATANIVIALVVVASSAPLVWLVSRLGAGRAVQGRLPWILVYSLAVIATAVGSIVNSSVERAFGRAWSWSATSFVDVLIVGPIWIVLIGSGVVLWQSARAQRQQLTDSLQEIESLVESGVDVTHALEVVTRRELRRGLVGISLVGERDSAVSSIVEWRRISEELRELSHAVVRPLSHDLPRTRGEGVGWRSGPVGWLRRIVSREDFNPLLVAAVFTAGAVSVRIQDYGWVVGLGLLVAENVLIFAVMLPANALMKRVRLRAVVYLGTVAVLQIIPILPWPQVLGETTAPSVGERFTSVIASVLLILIASGVRAIRTQSEERIEQLRELVNQAASAGSREANHIARIMRNVAARLHGSVQTTLVSAAFAIESAAQEGRWDDARRSLDSLIAVFDEATTDPSDDAGGIAEAIDRVSLPWQAVGNVDVTVDESMADLSRATVDVVTRVIEEALTNAFRHGRAQRVAVSVHHQGGAVVVRVTDDGLGVSDLEHGRWGLGLATIEEATGGRWSLRSQSGATYFEATIDLHI